MHYIILLLLLFSCKDNTITQEKEPLNYTKATLGNYSWKISERYSFIGKKLTSHSPLGLYFGRNHEFLLSIYQISPKEAALFDNQSYETITKDNISYKLFLPTQEIHAFRALLSTTENVILIKLENDNAKVIELKDEFIKMLKGISINE